MKIAITGHTAGIGKALAEQYSNRGHEIVGLSKPDVMKNSMAIMQEKLQIAIWV